jgi:ribonuclease E
VGSLGSVGQPPSTGAVEPGTADTEPSLSSADGQGPADGSEDAPVVEHVPVKKKGSRKR